MGCYRNTTEFYSSTHDDIIHESAKAILAVELAEVRYLQVRLSTLTSDVINGFIKELGDRNSKVIIWI